MDIDPPKLFSNDSELFTGTPILSSTFFLQPDHTQPITLILTDKSILYHQDKEWHNRKGFFISFETIYQILRTKSIKVDERTVLGTVHGLKFMRNDFSPQEFYTPQQTDLEKWEQELHNVMNQYNFHDLFRAEKKLGKGNFATVYLGIQLKDQRKVAIKAFGKEATYSQENGKEAIINEIKITRMFNHPNLMKLEGVYESDNSVYFALEYVEGTPICSRFNSLARYSESERKFIIKGILRGIAEMARRNVIHRDLKPDNIILSKEPIIIDFGLATLADDPNYLFVRCGTPGYVAPEIINIKDLTTKSHPISDIFSVGCIFYYIIFSKHLFMGVNASDIIAKNRECDIVLTGSEFDKLNQKEVDLLRKMLQKQPFLRISAVEALNHPYFTDSNEQLYTPKIQMKQSGSCPLDLISSDNEAAVKFITTIPSGVNGKDKLEETKSVVRSYDRSTIKKKIEQIDVNRLLKGV